MSSVDKQMLEKVTSTQSNGELQSSLQAGVILPASEEKALVRKIDLHLLPLMFFAYMLQFLDKTALGYTAIFGIQKDLALIGDQYSWASSAFYFGYLAASYPVSILLVKLPLGTFLAVSFLCWAVVLACHGAASNFGGLLALRLLLGALESSISPGLSMMTGVWYKRDEHVSRHGVWFAGNGTASLIGGLLAYGIGHINNSVAAWRWIFIIFGIFTFAYGVAFLVFLPKSPLNARFLTPDERQIAYQRPQQDTHTSVSHKWSKSQFIEAMIDPKSWLLFIFTVATCIPNGGLTSFGSIVVSGFGFSTFNTLLLQMPTAAATLILVVLSSFITSKIRYSRCLTMAVLQLISIAGALVVSQVDPEKKLSRLGGMFLFPAFSASLPISMSLIASNVAGYTKKATTSSIMFIGYCTGNIIGPFLFFSKEAPAYESAWLGIMISHAIAFVTVLVLRQLFDYQNRSRNRKQGVNIDPEAYRAADAEEIIALDKNETDWENQSFRYYL